MDGKSLNIKNQKLEELKALLPDVFTEGKIDFDRLKAALGEDVFVHGEHYELSWAGKTEARKEIQKQTTATFIPDREGSIDFDNAQNIFIEGENLEVLRALQKAYFGKVKMIYIDPPYNTGNDSFVYPDDYTERREAYNKRTGITDDEGYLNKQDLWQKNSRENGQFHSVWLCMMYPRLYLARNLMCEDGVIFVSIDDNEQGNLKLLMDDIFGEENFIASIVWQKRTSPDARLAISNGHEYVLVYAKNFAFSDDLIGSLPLTEEQKKDYKNPDNDPRGPWVSSDFTAQIGHATPQQFYTITAPNGKKHVPPAGTCWKNIEPVFLRKLSEGRFWFGKDGNGFPRRKTYLSETEGRTIWTWWTNKEVGHTQEGTKELKEILNLSNAFDNPKPTRLLKRMIQFATDEDSIILDFFVGSGTTAQAVMDVNSEFGGNRKFICVQIPESIPDDNEAKKAGYNNIADISKARIKRVIEKLENERTGKLGFDANSKQHLGFKAYKIAPSNFKIWRNDVENKEDLIEQLQIFTQAEKQDSTQENMLYELVLKAGQPLTSPIETMIAGTTNVYNVNSNKMFVFFDKLSSEITSMCIALKPGKVVCLNSCFEKDEDLTNFKLQLKEAGIELTIV